MNAGDGTAGYIARWGPLSVSPEAAAFAREVTARCGHLDRERAKNLLWAAGKLADYAIGRLGLDPVPQVLLHPSVIERFAAHSPGLSQPARRTLRTNLRNCQGGGCFPAGLLRLASCCRRRVLAAQGHPNGCR